ncbi:hypothetical protein L249_0961 [Ophiocordyceps polyrhachis-furcata BCC 54312]|uniref:Uncharacterized protein n=1 Tax=Ophiocordyceps polyrhachis-furcata BCC 54312 TaxID=1330021 RepID=A0A367LCL3_9HYPO|nr:hypothetical protein L249_0961 [Ophiocordyceps polyrhachis-furcata BCC 54312]
MLSKTTFAMLGAFAAYQGVSANLKPVDQAVKDGDLPVDAAETVYQSCGGKKIDPTSSKPCDMELVENAKLFGIVTAMKDKSDPARTKGWLELWQNSSIHHARDCCIQCKLDVWHQSGKAAGMSPNQAQKIKTEFYSRDKYLKAWEAKDANHAELMDEWQWRSSRYSWPAAEESKSEQDVKFVRDETCPSLPNEPKTELPKEALGQTVVCPTVPNSFLAYEPIAVNGTEHSAVKGAEHSVVNGTRHSVVNSPTNVNVNTPQVNVVAYLQPRYVVAVLSETGVSGDVLDAPAEKIEQAPSKVLAKDLSPQVIREDACNVCAAGPAKPAGQIFQSKPTSEEIRTIKSQVQDKGSVDVNILISHSQPAAAVPYEGTAQPRPVQHGTKPYEGTAQPGQEKPRPVQHSAKFGPAPQAKADSAYNVADTEIEGGGSAVITTTVATRFAKPEAHTNNATVKKPTNIWPWDETSDEENDGNQTKGWFAKRSRFPSEVPSWQLTYAERSNDWLFAGGDCFGEAVEDRRVGGNSGYPAHKLFTYFQNLTLLAMSFSLIYMMHVQR